MLPCLCHSTTQKLLDALAECERAASMGDPIVTRLNSLGEVRAVHKLAGTSSVLTWHLVIVSCREKCHSRYSARAAYARHASAALLLQTPPCYPPCHSVTAVVVVTHGSYWLHSSVLKRASQCAYSSDVSGPNHLYALPRSGWRAAVSWRRRTACPTCTCAAASWTFCGR